jgi:hypothetical protein
MVSTCCDAAVPYLFLFDAKRLRLLPQNRQPHRDVEPVDQMLAVEDLSSGG